MVGKRLPSIALSDLEGHLAELEAVAQGRPALVSFWATWCYACAQEFDALNRLEAKLGDEGIVLGVDVGEAREQVQAFTEARGLHIRQLTDEHMALADALGQRNLPVTLVIDRHGRVIFAGGALDERALAALRAAIAAR